MNRSWAEGSCGAIIASSGPYVSTLVKAERQRAIMVTMVFILWAIHKLCSRGLPQQRDMILSQAPTASGQYVFPWGSSTKSVSSVVLIANDISFAIMSAMFTTIGSVTDHDAFGCAFAAPGASHHVLGSTTWYPVVCTVRLSASRATPGIFLDGLNTTGTLDTICQNSRFDLVPAKYPLGLVTGDYLDYEYEEDGM
ncbi:hypothetical protein C8R48DRAFT_793061 [Suillus tomentosus]|nr:hypothetical protein C8R48DRAFT_793061 [Suillus tomentosus]